MRVQAASASQSPAHLPPQSGPTRRCSTRSTGRCWTWTWLWTGRTCRAAGRRRTRPPGPLQPAARDKEQVLTGVFSEPTLVIRALDQKVTSACGAGSSAHILTFISASGSESAPTAQLHLNLHYLLHHLTGSPERSEISVRLLLLCGDVSSSSEPAIWAGSGGGRSSRSASHGPHRPGRSSWAGSGPDEAASLQGHQVQNVRMCRNPWVNFWFRQNFKTLSCYQLLTKQS